MKCDITNCAYSTDCAFLDILKKQPKNNKCSYFEKISATKSKKKRTNSEED